MNEAPKHTPRPGDLPRAEIAKLADEAIVRYGGPNMCEVRFKFTCVHCGTRCSFSEPNALYEEGECCACGKSTTVTAAGFSMHFKIGLDNRKN
jgi:hypothetical protein